MMYINLMVLDFGDSFILHHFLEQNVEYQSSISNHESWVQPGPITVVPGSVEKENFSEIGFKK